MFTEYMYSSSGNGNGKRRIAAGLFRNVKSSRKVSLRVKVIVTVGSSSAFQDQAGAGGPRDARHDLLAAGLFLFREPVVVMQQLALQLEDLPLALAAGAAPAQGRRGDPRPLDPLQQAPLPPAPDPRPPPRPGG